jgi:sulfatase modifying factor 1
MLVGVGAGCSREELAPVGASSSSGESLLAAALTPSPAAHLAPTMTQYAKEARISPLGARTLANTAGLLPGRTSANSIGSTGGLDPFLAAIAPGGPLANNGLCPPDMASIDDRFCVDRYEASLLEVLPDGTEAAFSPYESVKGHVVRAVSEPGVFPQGYISEIEATTACAVSGKRLCKAKEWRQACMGPEHKRYGYADKSHQGACNDHGRSPVTALYSDVNLGRRDTWDWERMNNPQLNQLEGTLAHTGEHSECTNDYGVYDMVGNLHEWVDDPKGTFQGGYYQDTTMNGEGCQYVTMAHEARYHDYSTGFRCCSDVAP